MQNKVYVATSWKNDYFYKALTELDKAEIPYYNFREPCKGNNGFAWKETDPNWEFWDVEQYKKGLEHPIAEQGFAMDFAAMNQCSACLLLLPCGRSAHVEAGYFAGQRKPVVVCIPIPGETFQPELMYKMFDCITGSIAEAALRLKVIMR